MGTDKNKFGGLLYLDRKGERTFQQKEMHVQERAVIAKPQDGEMSDGVHLTVILGRPSKTLTHPLTTLGSYFCH